MLQTRIRQFLGSVREGVSAGFISGMLVIFLILLGIPINLRDIALFVILLVPVIFGVRLARRLYGRGLFHMLRNALVLGLVAALLAYLLMALINRWQEHGVNVTDYFPSVTTDTMTVLSGVPASQLFPNPPRDPLTGKYPEGKPLRTNPMRLSFDEKTGLEVLGFNLIIGGFYGFLIALIVAGVAGTLLGWVFLAARTGQRWKAARAYLSTSPAAHNGVLLLPIAFFALLWLTVGHGLYNANKDTYSILNPVLDLGGSAQEVQLLIGFGIILWGLVAVRAAQPTDKGLSYPARLGVCLGLIALLTAVGLWRVLGSETYFVATSRALRGSETISVLILLAIGGLLAVQNARALRTPGRFEAQFAGTQALLVVLLMPLFLNQGQNDVMTIVGINIMLGLGLNIVVGYAGLLDLGYVAFFALGAYAYAFLSSNQIETGPDGQPAGLKFAGNDEMVVKLAGWIPITVVVTLLVVLVGVRWWQRRNADRRSWAHRPPLVRFPSYPGSGFATLLTVIAIVLSVIAASALEGTGLYDRLFKSASPFVIGVIVGVIVAMLSGIMLGIPVLRLRGDYLAIVTLGFGEIIRLLFTNLRDYTGGPQGVLEIPRPLPAGATGPVGYLWMVYLVLLGVGIIAFFSTRLKQSRIGRAWSAMKSDEDIAQSMGINLVQTKLTAFAIGAAFAGLGGVLFAARQRNIYPNDFRLDVSIEVLSLVIIGGMGSIPGVIMGAIVLIGVPEVLRELATYRILVFGALLVAMVILRPEGLLPAPTAQLRERARALVQSRYQPEGGD